MKEKVHSLSLLLIRSLLALSLSYTNKQARTLTPKESASGLAVLQIHFNMRKCQREKKGKDVPHGRETQFK